MSAVYFVQEADRGVAVWRASDEAPEVFLCSVALTAYDSDSQVRDRFAELVSVVADHFRRQHVAGAVDPRCDRRAALLVPAGDDDVAPARRVRPGEVQAEPGGSAHDHDRSLRHARNHSPVVQ